MKEIAKRCLPFLRWLMRINSRLNELTRMPVTFLKRAVLPGVLTALVLAFGIERYVAAVQEELFRADDQNKISSLTFVHALQEKEVGLAEFTIFGGDKPRPMMLLSKRPRVSTSPQYISSTGLCLYATPDEGILAANSDWRAPLQGRTLEAFDVSETMKGYDGQPGMGLMIPPGAYSVAVRDLEMKGGLARAVVNDASLDGGEGRLVRARVRGRTSGEEHRLVLIFTVSGSGKTSVWIRARGPSLESPLTGILDAVSLEVRCFTPGLRRTICMSEFKWENPLSESLQIVWTREPTARLDLKAGHYVVIVRSRDGADGIAQIELFEGGPVIDDLVLN